ncbi:MAG TPA: tetratricopeptide repeat protein [Thermoanaerobaculia bacterium]|nr:tetratricopeptide repeat protein [Thermoanaerobaculia bacterium]
MPDQHVTRALYQAVERGELPPEAINHRFAHHAMALCPTCREEYRTYVEGRGTATASGHLTTVILLEAYRFLGDHLRELEERARGEFLELLGLPAERRKERVTRATKRFRNPLLVEVLLEASQARIFSQPQEALRFARLAFHVALRSDVTLLGHDPAHELMLRALAAEANALRVLGDLPRADSAIAAALQKLDSVTDLESRAEIASLAASLRRDQRRFAEALLLIDRSITLYAALSQHHQLARCLILKANILSEAGRLAEAIRIDQQALDRLDPAAEPRLYLCVQHNLTWHLEMCRAYADARQRHDANRHLYAAFKDRWTQLRRRWLEGKIAHGLGEWEEAERALVEVRDGFIRRNHAYDAALASLDLALLYADLGRTAEMQQLARQMMPIFRAQEVHREALAALLVFWEAASREAVTRGMVESLTSYLRKARRDPSFRYEPTE